MTSPEYNWSSQSEDSSSESQVSVHEVSKKLSSPSSNGSRFESENEVHDIDADFEGETFCCSSSPYSDRLENWNSPPRSESLLPAQILTAQVLCRDN